jgi:hypothetical protein
MCRRNMQTGIIAAVIATDHRAIRITNLKP